MLLLQQRTFLKFGCWIPPMVNFGEEFRSGASSSPSFLPWASRCGNCFFKKWHPFWTRKSLRHKWSKIIEKVIQNKSFLFVLGCCLRMSHDFSGWFGVLFPGVLSKSNICKKLKHIPPVPFVARETSFWNQDWCWKNYTHFHSRNMLSYGDFFCVFLPIATAVVRSWDIWTRTWLLSSWTVLPTTCRFWEKRNGGSEAYTTVKAYNMLQYRFSSCFLGNSKSTRPLVSGSFFKNWLVVCHQPYIVGQCWWSIHPATMEWWSVAKMPSVRIHFPKHPTSYLNLKDSK